MDEDKTLEAHQEAIAQERLERISHWLSHLPRFPENVTRVDLKLHFDDGQYCYVEAKRGE